MKKIYKYKLNPVLGEQHLTIPKTRTFLAFDFQGNTPVIWAMVETDSVIDIVYVSLHFTGDAVGPPMYTHLGTATNSDGLVWHLFTLPRTF